MPTIQLSLETVRGAWHVCTHPIELLKFFVVNFWQVCRVIAPTQADVVVAIGYGTQKDRLTIPSETALRRAIEWWGVTPEAMFAFTNASHAFPGSDREESRLKHAILMGAGVPSSHILDAGPIRNSVEEGRAIKRVLAKNHVAVSRMIIVCEKMHTRSVRRVFQILFPRVEVILRCIPFDTGWDPKSPFSLARGPWRWMLANILRHLSLCVLGLTLTALVQHPADAKV